MLTNYCGLWKERPDREFALFIKFIISHKRRQIGHIFIWLFFIIFRRTINSHSQWVPQVTKHPVYHYTIVFNNCLNSYYFPSNWKIAKIKALKKGKEGINPSNYWPISLLSNISKIFGTIINDSINSFCTDNSIISKTQFGFRYKHSTIHGNNHKIYIRHMLDKKMCEDGFITLIQARSITDLGTNPGNQQMFTELVLSSKSSQDSDPLLTQKPKSQQSPISHIARVQSRSTQTINRCKVLYIPQTERWTKHSCSPSRQIYFSRQCPFVVIIIRDCTCRCYT